MSFRIALVQLEAAGRDLGLNLEIGSRACREAKAGGADLVLFPEMWSAGYALPEERLIDADRESLEAELGKWKALAIDEGHGFIRAFQSQARELGIAIGASFLERRAGLPRNAFALIDRRGEIALRYAKTHLCAFGAERFCSPGDSFPVCRLDYGVGAVSLGAMICFDREFPEPARILALEGAEIVLVPNACVLEPHRIEQVRTRAFENMVGIAVANYPPPLGNGHSLAVGPQAFSDSEESLDTTILEAPEAPGIYFADFDLEALRAWRKKEVWGSRYRRPELYGRLTGG